MEKQFVPYELAVKLKELGFDYECFTIYFKSGIIKQTELSAIIGYLPIDITHKESCLAPLWQQAFDWFREKYDLHGDISFRYQYFTEYVVNVFEIKGYPSHFKGCYSAHEQARHACLEKLIELITKND